VLTMTTRKLPLTLLLMIVIVSTVSFLPVQEAGAAFAVPPTMDLTVSSRCSGATDAVYKFHAENPNAGETVVAFSVPIPAGYSVNPAYLTTMPGNVVMAGVYGPVGTVNVNGLLSLETTNINGQFAIIATNTNPPFPPVPIGQANLVPPTSTATTWTVTLLAPNNGEYIEMTFAAGFFINPEIAGVYTWGPSTATPSAGPQVTINPRPGFTNQVPISTCPVGGVVMSTNKLEVLAPYLALAGLVAAVSTVVVVKKRKD
jgi:hypothetical protein